MLRQVAEARAVRNSNSGREDERQLEPTVRRELFMSARSRVRNATAKLSAGSLAILVGLFLAGTTATPAFGQMAPSNGNPDQAQGGQGQGGKAQDGQGQAAGRGGRSPAMDPAEENALKDFNAATDVDAKIQAGEDFDRKFPSSPYAQAIDSTLITLYYQKQDWPKFYATADRVLAKNPDNAPILAQVGWVIPHIYNTDDPNGPAKLDQSEKYEKHALELIAGMTKPAQVTDDQFDQAKAELASMAHSGLGLTYYRRNNFANSAKELEIATTESSEIDPSDLYVLGVDYQKLDRNTDASQAFTKCGQMQGDLQSQCQKSAAALQNPSLAAPSGGSK